MSFPQGVAETQHNQVSSKHDFDSAINHGAAAAGRKPLSQHLFRNRTPRRYCCAPSTVLYKRLFLLKTTSTLIALSESRVCATLITATTETTIATKIASSPSAARTIAGHDMAPECRAMLHIKMETSCVHRSALPLFDLPFPAPLSFLVSTPWRSRYRRHPP